MDEGLSQYQVLVELILRLARGQQMAPWQEAGYFLDPDAVTLNVSPATAPSLVGSSGNRVGLIISATGSCWVCPFFPTVGSTGILLTSQQPTFVCLFSQLGLICQKQWYVNNLGGSFSGTVTALEVKLREWPGR